MFGQMKFLWKVIQAAWLVLLLANLTFAFAIVKVSVLTFYIHLSTNSMAIATRLKRCRDDRGLEEMLENGLKQFNKP